MLKSAVLAAVEAARLAAQDLIVEATLTHRESTAHIPGVAPIYSDTVNTLSLLATKFEDKEIDGQRVRASDFKYLAFPKTGVEPPVPNDLLEIGSVSYRVIHNDRVMAGDTVALSQLQVRLV